MTVTEFLDRADIHLHFKAASVVEAIPELLQPALARRIANPQVVKDIVDAAVRREEETSTMCGVVSLPHARSADIDRFIVTLGVHDDGRPRLIFAFVSPDAKREQHLQLLASLAKISQNPTVVDSIAAASSADQVIDVMHKAGM